MFSAINYSYSKCPDFYEKELLFSKDSLYNEYGKLIRYSLSQDSIIINGDIFYKISSIYLNGDIVLQEQYDSLGNYMFEHRAVFYSFARSEYFLGDTVCFFAFSFGRVCNDIKTIIVSSRIVPDEYIYFKQYAINPYCNNMKGCKFVPPTLGRYEIGVATVIDNTRHIVSDSRIYIDIKY